MAHAELDGLGPSDGPATIWSVPLGFAQGEPPTAHPFGGTPGSASTGEGAPGALWLGLGCLLLLVVFLVRGTRAKSPPR